MPRQRKKSGSNSSGQDSIGARSSKPRTDSRNTARKKMLSKLKESWLFGNDATKMRCHLPPKHEVRSELGLSTGVFGSKPEKPPDTCRIPYFNLDGSERPFHRDRLLDEFIPDGQKKPQKYTQPRGASPEIYICPLLKSISWSDVADNPEVDLWLVEGELKAAAMCKIGFPCVGIGGVRNWTKKGRGELIDDFDLFNLEKRIVRICFDSDYADNSDVRSALYALAAKLRSRGAKVLRMALPRRLDL
jgi:hypothetical protein